MAEQLRRLPSQPPPGPALEDQIGKSVSDAIRLCAISHDKRAPMVGRTLLAVVLALAQGEDDVLRALDLVATGGSTE